MTTGNTARPASEFAADILRFDDPNPSTCRMKEKDSAIKGRYLCKSPKIICDNSFYYGNFKYCTHKD